MKIHTPQENRIVVELSRSDMTELDITYDEMDYGNIETRRVIWTILDRARRTLSRDIDPSGKLLIETVPTPEGGCVLCFTVMQKEPGQLLRQMLRIRKERLWCVYRFTDLDALTNCAETMRAMIPDLPRTELYLWQDAYYLLLSGLLPPRGCKNILSEYGTLCPEGSVSLPVLREHGKLLADGDAIERLSLEV